MVRLNDAEYTYSPGMSLRELVDEHNAGKRKALSFDGFIVLVNGAALSSMQAEERLLRDNDTIVIVPQLDGG